MACLRCRLAVLKTVRKKLEEHAGEGGVQGFLVSEMVRGGFECIVGVKRDPVFGPMIAVGLGGIYVEVLSDVSLRHGAVDEEEVNWSLEITAEAADDPRFIIYCNLINFSHQLKKL